MSLKSDITSNKIISNKDKISYKTYHGSVSSYEKPLSMNLVL